MYLIVPSFAKETIRSYISNIEPKPLRRIDVGEGIVSFVGDTHGALDVTSYLLQTRRGSSALCILGDVVDRGKNQLLNLLLVLESSLLNKNIILVRGNHESTLLNDYYGFTNELRSLGCYSELYPEIVMLYGKLPYGVLVNGELLGVHGGIPRGCKEFSDWDRLPMDDKRPSNQCAFEILWNDPSEELDDFSPGIRGQGTFIYGKAALLKFMGQNDISIIVRGHEVKMEGYEALFDGRLVSIFSSRYHGGKSCILDVDFPGGAEWKVEIIPDEKEFTEDCFWPL